MSYKWEWLGTNTNVAVDAGYLSVISTVANGTAIDYKLVIDGTYTNITVRSGAILGVIA